MTTKTIKAVGNLTQDPELRFADDGTPYMYLTVAVNDYARIDEGDWHQLPTVYWTVPVRGKLAENLAETLTKGAAVGFHGDPRQRAWIDNDGQIRIEHKITNADAWPDMRHATAVITRNPKHDDQQ